MTKQSTEVTPEERRMLFPDIQEAHLVIHGVTRTMLKEILGSRDRKAFERQADDHSDTFTFGHRRQSADEGEL